MQSNFSTVCKNARELIEVPSVPLAAIRRGADTQVTSRFGKRRRGFIAALITGASIAAVAAGAQVWSGSHIYFNRSGSMLVAFNRGADIKNPTTNELRSAARDADFPVVLPEGLPTGTTATTLMRGSSVLLLQYNLPGALRRSNHLLLIFLANPQTLSNSLQRAPSKFRLEFPLICGGNCWFASGGVHWTIGHEEVLIPRSLLTSSELAHIKSAMAAESRRTGTNR